LQRIVVQGAPIATALSGEAVEAANLAASITRDLAAAIKDPSTSPRGIEELERNRARARKTQKHKSATFQEFDEFMQRAVEARRRKEGETDE